MMILRIILWDQAKVRTVCLSAWSMTGFFITLQSPAREILTLSLKLCIYVIQPHFNHFIVTIEPGELIL